jgi:3-oxoadipate CoA-transferase alpha subunit
MRAAGAGIGAFFCPTGFGTQMAKNADGSPKESRLINGKHYVLEYPIHGDLALIKAEAGDRWGNLVYRKAARNFGPVMAMAAKKTVASVHKIVELGELDPEAIVTPGIFVSKIRRIEHKATEGGGFKRVPTQREPNKRWPTAWRKTSLRVLMSIWASASPPWWPTSFPKNAKSFSQSEMVFWAWGLRLPWGKRTSI